MEKFIELLQSRKFWTLVIGLTGIWTAVYVGTLTVPDAINASVGLFAGYMVGTGLEYQPNSKG